MFSCTVKSDGQLHEIQEAVRSHSAPPAEIAKPPRSDLSCFGMENEQLLIGMIALFLLKSDRKPDVLLLAALAYIFL